MLRTALPACRERSAACLCAHQLAGILTCASDAPWRQTEQSLLSSATMRSTIGARAHLPRFITHPNGIMGSGPLQKLPSWAQWGLLVAASVVLAMLLATVRLPAAWLLGPMVAGILVATNGGRIRAPRLPMLAAQSIVGCLIARAITPEILVAVAKDWPLFLSVVLTIIAGSALLGWIMSRLKVLPGTTAVWGMSPGAASAMMLMAGEFGADARLVAFMQYLRVVFVAAAASMVAGIWAGASPSAPAETIWFPAQDWQPVIATLALASAGAWLGVVLRLPAGALLVPMAVGAVLEATGLLAITLPPLLLAACYAFLGWSIGLSFTQEILRHAYRALPQVVLAILILIGLSGALAVVLVYAAGVDPLTAYLATSPGGMDTIAIIAASSHADVSFVMALQGLRFMIVLVTGPPLARLVARWT